MRRRTPSGRAPQEVVELRWLTKRSWTNRWYPQGIDVGVLQGRRMLAISWFRQDRHRHHLASRISFIDLAHPRHLDVTLAIEADDGTLEPARIHAGGIAWCGDRLFAAATRQGIWEFDLASLRTVRGAEARRLTGMPLRAALVAVRTRVHPIALRCSFIGRTFDASGAADSRLLIGEYRADDDGRIGEFALTSNGLDLLQTTSPGIREMQGATRWGDRIFVSQSDGLRPGTLWSGPFDHPTRGTIPLPAGCQDLAVDPKTRTLWSLGEHPWRRVIRGIPLSRLGIEHSDGERRLDR